MKTETPKRLVVCVPLGETLYAQLRQFREQNYGVSKSAVLREALAFFLQAKLSINNTHKQQKCETTEQEAGK